MLIHLAEPNTTATHPLTGDNKGRILSALDPDCFQSSTISTDATAAKSCKTKTAAKKIYVYTLLISVGTAMSVKIQDDAGTPEVLIPPMSFATNGGAFLVYPESAPLTVATNQDLDFLASTAGTVTVAVTGRVA